MFGMISLWSACVDGPACISEKGVSSLTLTMHMLAMLLELNRRNEEDFKDRIARALNLRG